MTRHLTRLFSLAILLCLTLSLSTCISAQETDYIKYDPATDQFQMLMILTDLHANDQDDLDYLAAIYRNRDHLIAPVLPGSANLFPLVTMSLIRHSDTQFTALNIFASRPGDLDLTKTAAHLDAIKITPGAFFLQNKSLGYYQAITVPGKTIDIALEELSQTAMSSDDFNKSLQSEIDRRANGGKTTTWARITADTLKSITLEPSATAPATTSAPATQPDDSPNPLVALDPQSLANLKQALTDKTLHLKRNHQILTLSLPLTPADSAALADLDQQIVKRVDQLLHPAKAPSKEDAPMATLDLQAFQAFNRALTITPNPQGLTLSLDLLLSTQAFAALPPHPINLNNNIPAPSNENNAPQTQPQPQSQPAPPDVIQYLRDQKIPLNQTLTPAQILQAFNAGTLQPHPSATPLPPGQGLASTTQPTTQP